MNRRKKIKELERLLNERDNRIFRLQRDMHLLSNKFTSERERAEELREEVTVLKVKLVERTQLLLEVQDKLLLPELRYNDNTGVTKHENSNSRISAE